MRPSTVPTAIRLLPGEKATVETEAVSISSVLRTSPLAASSISTLSLSPIATSLLSSEKLREYDDKPSPHHTAVPPLFQSPTELPSVPSPDVRISAPSDERATPVIVLGWGRN